VYHDKPHKGDGLLEAFIKDCQIISSIAERHDLVGAITEVGLRWNAMDGIAPSNNAIPDWYTWLLRAIKEEHPVKMLLFL